MTEIYPPYLLDAYRKVLALDPGVYDYRYHLASTELMQAQIEWFESLLRDEVTGL